jgi:hypothetical protein
MLSPGSKVQSRRGVDRERWSRCGLGPAGGIGNLRAATDDVERTTGERAASGRAIARLRALPATWTEADVPEAKADVRHADVACRSATRPRGRR